MHHEGDGVAADAAAAAVEEAFARIDGEAVASATDRTGPDPFTPRFLEASAQAFRHSDDIGAASQLDA
jgi:hypothetical protein